MIKKIMACILSLVMICCTCISAKALEPDEPSVPIDSSKFITMEGKNMIGASVSLIEHNIYAKRTSNGSVKVTINETFHTVRGYYEFLATDTKGEYFLPEKNSIFYTDNEGIYEITLYDDMVCMYGYIYVKCAIAPIDGDGLLVDTTYYKIPIC